MEEVKDMIHDQHIPMYLWDEEAKNEVYVHNKLPHSSLGNKNPK